MIISKCNQTLSKCRGMAMKVLNPSSKQTDVRTVILKTTRRYKRTSTAKKSISNTLKKQSQGGNNQEIFGLKPVDITIVPPLYGSPPPPPPASGFQKFLFPASVAITLGISGYFYFNNSNDSKDYWEAMQTGGALPGTYDDDDDDDEE
jgi:hypothetical protein